MAETVGMLATVGVRTFTRASCYEVSAAAQKFLMLAGVLPLRNPNSDAPKIGLW